MSYKKSRRKNAVGISDMISRTLHANSQSQQSQYSSAEVAPSSRERERESQSQQQDSGNSTIRLAPPQIILSSIFDRSSGSVLVGGSPPTSTDECFLSSILVHKISQLIRQTKEELIQATVALDAKVCYSLLF